jgi:anti-sigma factor RsiW
MNNKDVQNEKMPKDISANTISLPPSCARANDLIAYLYDEANATEAKSFAEHLHVCASCKSELVMFNQVRESVGVWREQALGSAAGIALQTAHESAAPDSIKIVQPQKPSALAALRQFFALSPDWMRAATAFATIALCALSVLAIVNGEFRSDANGLSFHTRLAPERIVLKQVVVEKPVKIEPSEEELNARVAARVQTELASIQQQQTSDRNTSVSYVASSVSPKRASAKSNGVSVPSNIARNTQGAQPKGRFVSTPQNRVEVADADLPRLSDLLSEGSER